LSIVELKAVTVDLPIYNVSTRSLRKAVMKLSTGGKIMQDGHQRVSIRALDRVSLKLEAGDRLGLLGHNGSGKTTLLRTIAGVYPPSRGQVEVKGDISSMFDLTMGMDMEASGEENIVLMARYRGRNLKEARAAMREIAEFTDLGAYLQMPVRTYSSGMLARLGFAVATSFQPDILLLDEWIATGDENFARKAQKRLEAHVAKSRVVCLATHNPALIRRFCNKVMILQAGRVTAFGDVAELMAA
jgi:ABC-type polysaccharide/polyol phosphate transport system ATPase subunit